MDNGKVIKAIEKALPYLGKTSSDGKLLLAAIEELRLKPTLAEEFPENHYRTPVSQEDVRNVLVAGMTGESMWGQTLEKEMASSLLFQQLEKIAQDTTNEIWSVTMRRDYKTPGDYKRAICYNVVDAMTHGIFAKLGEMTLKKVKRK